MLQAHHMLLLVLSRLLSQLTFCEPFGIGVLCHMFCPPFEPALRATCEEVSAAWQAGAHPSLWVLGETRRSGAGTKAALCWGLLLERRSQVVWIPQSW